MNRTSVTRVARGSQTQQRDRDRDAQGRARQGRPRDRLGRPLPHGGAGVEPVSEQPLPPLGTISSARDLLADGRPFSAHEVFEARWKAGPDAERDLWQGLAQLCVGITHAERGNLTGALRLIGGLARGWKPTQPPEVRPTSWKSTTLLDGSGNGNVIRRRILVSRAPTVNTPPCRQQTVGSGAARAVDCLPA